MMLWRWRGCSWREELPGRTTGSKVVKTRAHVWSGKIQFKQAAWKNTGKS